MQLGITIEAAVNAQGALEGQVKLQEEFGKAIGAYTPDAPGARCVRLSLRSHRPARAGMDLFTFMESFNHGVRTPPSSGAGTAA